MNNTIRKKAIALSLCVSLCGAAAVTAFGIEPSYTVGRPYRESKYYERLSDISKTGDERYDVIAVAISQLGYHEGNSDSEMHGGNNLGSKNFTEYNKIFGSPVDNGEGNGVSYGFEWCAAFVSWCQRQARVPSSSVITEISCIRMVDWLLENGAYKSRSSGYSPLCADLIFFRASSSSSRPSHVGLVVGTDELYIYTIEGNNGGRVNYHKYRKTDSRILGYGTPKYKSVEGISYDFALEDGYFEPGVYKTTAELNLRSGPSTAYSSLLKIPLGTKLTVTEGKGNWARVSYGGKSGYCSLNYLSQTEVMVYTVSYDANGGDGAPESQKKEHSIKLELSGEVPTREAHVFVGWSKSSDGERADFAPNDTYVENSSVKLYAVWEYVGYTVSFYDDAGNLISSAKYDLGDEIEAPEPPQKNGGVIFVYEFSGWSPELQKSVSGDASYTAVYEKKFVFTNTESESESSKPEEEGSGDGSSDITPNAKTGFLLDPASLFAVFAATATVLSYVFIFEKRP